MVVRLYSVFDRVAQEFSPISEAVNDGVAWRMYRQVMQENPNASDFQVMYVGDFDRKKGVLTPARIPVVIDPTQLELELSPKEVK